MKYSVFTAAAASAALLVSGPLLAQQSNGKQTREQSRQNSQGPDNASKRGIKQSNENSVLKGSGGNQSGSDMQKRDKMRDNSQGRANASDRGRDRANRNSAVGNVQPGMMVKDRGGKTVGRVGDVKRAPDGTVIAIIVVLVVQINGASTITLTPGSFTIINNIIVTAQITAPTGG